MACPIEHVLHSSYAHKVTAAWSTQGATVIPPSSLVWPLFIVDDDDAKQEIGAMPDQYRWGANRLKEALDEPVANGLQAVLLFGVVGDDKKSPTGAAADTADSPVVKALRTLRTLYGSKLLLMVDVCLCAYTDHGHCGIMTPEHHIDNTASIARLAAVSVSYASAGADVIAPSDMMDGRIGAIKKALQAAGLGSRVSVMSYAAKFASCFYGPFRDAAHSGMAFGDRSLYQLPPGSRSLALRALSRDEAEGADFLMVKPGLPYLDICREAADKTGLPIAVYQVSGEYAMLWHAAKAGALDLKKAVTETATAFRRAGVTIIITYFAPLMVKWSKE